LEVKVETNDRSSTINDFEIVDLDLTMFKGIGTNHQRSFERNIHGRNSLHNPSLSESRSLLLSVNEDWKSFAMNHRHVPKELY